MLNLTKLTTLLALCALAGAASAQAADPTIDINGDGFYSFPELSTVYLDITADDFVALDTTGDGLLDMAEVVAAQQAGLLPQTG